MDDGKIYEGVFRTFSPEMDVTLAEVHQVDPNDPTRVDPLTVKSTGVFSMKRILRCVAVDVDLNYAKDGFQTDSQISGATKVNGARELEKWIPDGDEDTAVSLETEIRASEANGWRAEDMFKANEETYGVQSTYKSNLEGYTLQLSADKTSSEYR